MKCRRCTAPPACAARICPHGAVLPDQAEEVEGELAQHLKEVRRLTGCAGVCYVALNKDTHLLEVPEVRHARFARVGVMPCTAWRAGQLRVHRAASYTSPGNAPLVALTDPACPFLRGAVCGRQGPVLVRAGGPEEGLQALQEPAPGAAAAGACRRSRGARAGAVGHPAGTCLAPALLHLSQPTLPGFFTCKG